MRTTGWIPWRISVDGNYSFIYLYWQRELFFYYYIIAFFCYRHPTPLHSIPRVPCSLGVYFKGYYEVRHGGRSACSANNSTYLPTETFCGS